MTAPWSVPPAAAKYLPSGLNFIVQIVSRGARAGSEGIEDLTNSSCAVASASVRGGSRDTTRRSLPPFPPTESTE